MNTQPHHKKGLIFALDGAIAVTVVVLMVINSVYYFSVASKSSLSHLQSVNLAGDIITVYEQLGAFDAIVVNNTKSQFWMNYQIMPSQLNLSRFLPSNYEMWVSVSDLKETVLDSDPVLPGAQPHCGGVWGSFWTAPLERKMDALVEMNITGIGQYGILVQTKINGKQTDINPYSNGTTVVGMFPFNKGQNNLTVRIDGACAHWFRVLGSEAYAGSTNETMYANNLFPKDRFIGSGEHFVTIKKPWALNIKENPIEGTHRIRYRIWLKGGTSL
ncbi:MAG: hypothetical protein AABX72_04295 [Nanoarchaeota archaeon]